MREWRVSKKELINSALDIPADLKKIIETSLSQVWGSASKLASTAIENVRQEAKKDVGAAIQERDEAMAEITRLEGQITTLEKQGTEKDKEIEEGQKTLEAERAKSAQLVAENSALSVRIEERNTQIIELKATLKDAVDGNKSLQAELIEIAKGST